MNTTNQEAKTEVWPDKSQLEIERWSKILNADWPRGIARLRSYICSLTLGRDFNEDFDAYIIRRGLVRFMEYARHELLGWQPKPR